MRLQYPPDIKVIMMPCTGRVDILHLLKAFEGGADAVFVAGCLEGECHYLKGNIQARKRVGKVKKDFAQMGLEPERIEMFNLSSSEGPRFAAIAKEMVERTLKLGPSFTARSAISLAMAANLGPSEEERLNISSRSGSKPMASKSFLTLLTRFLARRLPFR